MDAPFRAMHKIDKTMLKGFPCQPISWRSNLFPVKLHAVVLPHNTMFKSCRDSHPSTCIDHPNTQNAKNKSNNIHQYTIPNHQPCEVHFPSPQAVPVHPILVLWVLPCWHAITRFSKFGTPRPYYDYDMPWQMKLQFQVVQCWSNCYNWIGLCDAATVCCIPFLVFSLHVLQLGQIACLQAKCRKLSPRVIVKLWSVA